MNMYWTNLMMFHILYTLFGIVICGNSTQDYQFFNQYKDYFNSENFKGIYFMLSPSVRIVVDQSQFIQKFEKIFDLTGQIQFETYLGDTMEIVVFGVSYQKNLHTSFVQWKYIEDYLEMLYVEDLAQISIYSLLQQNPQKGAITVIQNNVIVNSYNENRQQSLCSVMKIPVAIEGLIDQNQLVNISDINKFWIQNFDNAHESFLSWIEIYGKLVNNQVTLYTVAQGMMIFSSNANTEFLQTILGIDNIEINIKNMDLYQTKQIYLVSAMLALQNFYNLTDPDYFEYLNQMNDTYFYDLQYFIHENLMKNTADAQIWLSKASIDLLKPQVVAVSANRLVNSTTYEYTRLMNRINTGDKIFADYINDLYKLLGVVSSSSASGQYLFEHSGVKGGSAYVQNDTNAVFALSFFDKLNRPDKIQYFSLTLLFDQLNDMEYQNLLSQINSFSTMAMTNSNFNHEFSNRLAYSNLKVIFVSVLILLFIKL